MARCSTVLFLASMYECSRLKKLVAELTSASVLQKRWPGDIGRLNDDGR